MGGRVAFWAVIAACGGCGRVGFDRVGGGTGDLADGGGSNAGSDGSVSGALTLPAVADTALNSFAPTINYGAATFFNLRSDMVSTFVGLIRFDLSSVTGTVTSARLRITTASPVLGTGTIDVIPVLEAWEEGTQVAGTGTANFAFRQGLNAWTSAGCGPGSRDTAVVAQLQPYMADTVYDVTLDVSTVQAWVQTPASNHGVVLVPVGTGNDIVQFTTRESDVPAKLLLDVAP